MPRFKLTIEYDGTPYVGWQRQDNGRSVQAAIEAAILAFTGETVTLRGAGRTDTGVHALGQVAHVDLAKAWGGDKIRDALNAHLRDEPVVILLAEPAAPEFDARFSAKARHYLYRILDRRAPAAVERDRIWHVRNRLDAEAMQAATAVLIGHHDFTTFRSTACQSASPEKTLDHLMVRRDGERLSIEVSARSFLHNQVRSMVGSLAKVGLGKWSAADLQAALDARDRKACGPVAPAAGLYLTRVDY